MSTTTAGALADDVRSLEAADRWGARFVLRLARREMRGSIGRSLLLTASVTAGVAALVAVQSFSDALQGTVRREARSLMGADLAISSTAPFTAKAEERLADMQARDGASLARVTTFGAMAMLPRTGATRLVQVMAVEGGWPFYGTLETKPAGLWPVVTASTAPADALVDEALLVALGAEVGDTVQLGEGRFTLRGTVHNLPGDVGLRAALGPRLFIPRVRAAETGLLKFGSRARYEAFLQLPQAASPDPLALRHRAVLAQERANLRTVSEEQRSFSNSLGRLAAYLKLVALLALLLGGVGVASAVHVFVRRKLDTIAVLRCLGATGPRLVAAYLVQTLAMGVVGSAAGAVLGLAVQGLLPRVVGDFLPVEVGFEPSWRAVALGVGLGLLVSTLGALVPLLSIRQVSPLVLLRREFETLPGARRDKARWAALAAAAVALVAVSIAQAPSPGHGVVFSVVVALVLGVLLLAARLLATLARRVVRPSWPYVWRQGLRNLHRPANQTVAVVLALGFGAFLLGVLVLLQANLLSELRVDRAADRPNMVLFDIQPDQRDGVAKVVAGAGHVTAAAVPVVPMRIATLKGVPAASLLGTKAEGADSRSGWAVRREYRSTYRDTPGTAETVTQGEEWARGSWKGRDAGAGPVPISVEQELARELNVTIGDEIVWDVQGLQVASRVVALRQVVWARFEPNFFVVFPEGPLDEAPQTFVTLTRVEDPSGRAALQRDLVKSYPNVSAVDLSQVQQAVETTLGRVSLAIRFMALFSLAAGIVVLAGAVASSRGQRVREGALLKALGATRAQVLRIAVAEYASLGLLAAFAGLAVAIPAGWALLKFLFEASFTLPWGTLAGLGAGLVTVALAVGLANAGEVFRRTSLDVLRTE